MPLILVFTALSNRPRWCLAAWVLYLASFAQTLRLPRTNDAAPQSTATTKIGVSSSQFGRRHATLAFFGTFVGVSAYTSPPPVSLSSSFRRRRNHRRTSLTSWAPSLEPRGCPQRVAESLVLSRSRSSRSSRRTTCLFSSTPNSNSNQEDEEEWHPRDPAHSTPQLLAGIWHQISEASSMPKGETYSVLYPQMQTELNTPRFMQSLFHHLDVCKDVCDHFGISTTLVPLHDSKTKQVVGFTSKSFRDPKDGSDSGEEDMEFPYDPMWDDGTDYDTLYAGIDDEYDDAGGASSRSSSSAVRAATSLESAVPSDDEAVIDVSQRWVGKLMSDMGICPFTSGPHRAGLPLGDVLYTVDRATTVEDVYARFWKETIRIEQVKEKDLSTTLLIVPHFFLDNVEMFENFSTTLTQALTSLQVEDLLQLVFFHPHWSFRDGMDRSGAGSSAAANYARRSPWPMINLLRTTQVRAAQRGIPTGAVYQQNAKALAAVGVDQLESMLRKRDWSDIADWKVNRRELDALRIAQDYQTTGSVSQKDMSLEGDTTPAANKVDRRQVEQGDLVTVLLQAVDKRLGRTQGSSAPGQPQALSGPETSASAMAAEFLIQQLDSIVAGSSSASSALSSTPDTASATSTPVASGDVSPQEAARQARLEAARQALLADFAGADDDAGGPSRPGDRGDEMADILFGKGGIPDRADEQFNKGLDPSSFY